MTNPRIMHCKNKSIEDTQDIIHEYNYRVNDSVDNVTSRYYKWQGKG